MACNRELTDGILHDCNTNPKKGIDSGKAVLINYDDIDRAATVVNGATVNIQLKAGKAGFPLQWYKDLANASGTYVPSTENQDGFSHAFMCRLATTSATNAERSKELKNGRFVIAYETRFKGVDKLDAFKLGGFENGLRLSEMVTDAAQNSGSITFTISTEEGDFEEYPYHIFLETDYDVSRASFDALFAEV